MLGVAAVAAAAAAAAHPQPPPPPAASHRPCSFLAFPCTQAYQWTRPIPTSLKIIHSRVYAQVRAGMRCAGRARATPPACPAGTLLPSPYPSAPLPRCTGHHARCAGCRGRHRDVGGCPWQVGAAAPRGVLGGNPSSTTLYLPEPLHSLLYCDSCTYLFVSYKLALPDLSPLRCCPFPRSALSVRVCNERRAHGSRK